MNTSRSKFGKTDDRPNSKKNKEADSSAMKLEKFRKQADRVEKELKDSVSKKEIEEALNSLISLSDEGNPYAMCILADLHVSGTHVKKDMKKAYELYYSSWRQGIMDGAWKLAYEFPPEEYQEDYDDRFHFLEMAAKRDRATVIERLRKMGEGGDSEAYFLLGRIKESWSCSEREEKAISDRETETTIFLDNDNIDCYRMGADLGNPGAQYMLGEHLLRTDPSQIDRIIELFRSSAPECHKSAFMLGALYFCSRYVEEDLSESVKYLEMAEENGSEMAGAMLKFIKGDKYGKGTACEEEKSPHRILRYIGYAESSRKFNFPDRDLGHSPEWFTLSYITGDYDEACYGYTTIEEHSNNRGGYENNVFAVRPFYWGDEREENFELEYSMPNFLYKPTGLEIEWYKYPFRDSYMSQKLNETDLRKIWRACVESVIRDVRELRKKDL